MGLKRIVSVTGEVNTADDTWTTIASCAIGADCGFIVKDIFAQGKTTNGTIGEIANALAIHKGKRVSGIVYLPGSIVFILTFSTGSDAALTTCSMQLIITGTNLLLQVKGIGGGSPRNISWYGGFTVIQN